MNHIVNTIYQVMASGIKLAIVGTRTYVKYDEFIETYKTLYENVVVSEIVSGGAVGVDAMAKQLARDYRITYKEFPAEWSVYGKSAAAKRNALIVDYCDELLAIWDGESRGTAMTVNMAKASGKKYMICLYK